jgi:LmbE family N-acetylglucosaminyl deacetylase
LKRFVAWVGVPGLIVFAALHGLTQFPPAPGTGPGLAETIEAIDSARITTRILYITAHPDDESGPVLTYLARGLHADVALLSVTRGEGGQNDLGPEQAPQLGLIRTQELLAATRGYGVELYFTRARDFGFSKTPEETQKIWGDSVLEDMVRVIRGFRPNIVINNFGGVHGGHGHHQTAGLWAPKAVALAADPSAYPDMFGETLPSESLPREADSLRPWNGDGIPVQILDVERGSEKPRGFVLPLDEVSPLYGKTWREIGMDAFSNHRTQGVSVFFGSPFFRRPIALVPENGGQFDGASLAVPVKAWAERIHERCVAGRLSCVTLEVPDVDGKIAAAHDAALKLDWKAATENLATAAKILQHQVPPRHSPTFNTEFNMDQVRDFWEARDRVEHALVLAGGFRITADADRGELVEGESFNITTGTQCRREAACELGEMNIIWFGGPVNEKQPEGKTEYHFQVEVRPDPPASKPGTPPTDPQRKQQKQPAPDQPPLGQDQQKNIRRLPRLVDVSDRVFPEPLPIYLAEQKLTIAGYPLTVDEPVTHVEASSTHVVRVPLRVVPAVTLSVDPPQIVRIEGDRTICCELRVRVHSHATKPVSVTVGVNVDDPGLWKRPDAPTVDFSGPGDRYVKIRALLLENLRPGTYPLRVYAERGSEKFTQSLTPLPTMPTLLWSEPAQCLVHAFNINVPQNLRVGYITAENEPVPEALQRLGIHVEMLDAAALTFSDLSRFNAIVVGVRAYELRSDLRGANQRLLDYAQNGGTVVVQYERDFAWNNAQYAPYPAKIGGGSRLPRVTDENSPVKFLKPDDPLLNHPNKITQDDFQGWVQERGLYFWTQFDPKYTPLLAMNDPGEPEQNGSLVYTRYGKGLYIYTGLAFFRQVPEGVPGAYRLFANLLAAK